jgi:ubiquitin conjugation factor E4 A
MVDVTFADYFCEVFRIWTRSEVPLTSNGHPVEFVRIPNYDSFDESFFQEQGGAVVFDRLNLDRTELRESTSSIDITLKYTHDIEQDKVTFHPIIYLFECYVRCVNVQYSTEQTHFKDKLRCILIEQAALYLMQRDLYPSHADQTPVLLELVEQQSEHENRTFLRPFLTLVADELYAKLDRNDLELDQVLNVAYYVELNKRIEPMTLTSAELLQSVGYMRLLCSSPVLGGSFIRLNSPWHFPRAHLHNLLGASNVQIELLTSLLGNTLGMSCLPRVKDPKYDFFNGSNAMLSQELSSYEINLGTMVFTLVKEMHELFLSLLKAPDTRELTLNYFGMVLHHFHHRSKLWNNEMSSNVEISDGFMLNFCHVLLLLCKPFANSSSDKLLKISPLYTQQAALPLNVTNPSPMQRIHLRTLDQESCLVPKSEEERAAATTLTADEPQANSFNFMTEIFFLAHKAMQLGFKSTLDHFLNNITDISRYERFNGMTNVSPQEREMFRKGLEQHIIKHLSMRTILFQENFVEICVLFGLASCSWLTNVTMHKPTEDPSVLPEITTFLEPEFIQADFEETNQISPFLKFIPEFLCENISDFFIFVRRFVQKNMLLNRISFDPLMTFILTFMGSPLKMKNPHLRAKLAEILEELMPKKGIDEGHYLSSSSCTELFQKHRFIQHLIPTLIHVFVSIEVTGQSVAFEQKFQYRRPMYIVLRYLWTDPIIKNIHRSTMKQLSEEAIERIEDPIPPLFLRFLNLLTNDAIFLLDEGLQQMSKLRTLQNEKLSGQWNSLGREEQKEKERDFIMTEKLARFHNVMGKETINTLSFLSEEIKPIFCHSVMLDRIVSMLNYFLLHLVGPKKKQFKVTDGYLYEFKPALIVFDICKIYTNLGKILW